MDKSRPDYKSTANGVDDLGAVLVGGTILVLACIGLKHLLSPTSLPESQRSLYDEHEHALYSRITEEDLL